MPPELGGNEVDTWPSFSETVGSLPFATPPSLNMECLLAAARARSYAALDHLRKPRESAEYMTRCLQDWDTHWSQIPLSGFSTDPSIVENEGRKRLGRINSLFVGEAFYNAENWDMIAEKLEDINCELPTSGSATPHMSADLAFQVKVLLSTLAEMLGHALGCLGSGVSGSPEILGACSVGPGASGMQKIVASFANLTLKKSASRAQEEVFSLFQRLCTKKDREAIGLYNPVAEIQLRLDGNPNFAQCLSSWNVERFSDVACLVEIWTSFQLWQPYEMLSRTQADRAYEKTQEISQRNIQTGKKIAEYCHNNFLDPKDPALKWPINDAHSAKRTQQLTKAHGIIEAFWGGLDAALDLKEGSNTWQEGIPLPQILKDMLGGLYFISNQVWTQSSEAPGRDSEQSSEEDLEEGQVNASNPTENSKPVQTTLDAPLQALPLLVGKLNITAGPIVKSKKVKTHGLADPARAAPAGAGAAEPLMETPQPISVDAQAFETFQDLFSKKKVGSMAWRDFSSAMNAAGFAVHKQGGVSWLFRSQELGNISFHAPHGKHGSVMEDQKRRDVAGDLQRKYGWSIGSFVVT